MIEPWARRAFAWGAFAALVHSAAWAGFVYHLERTRYDGLEQRQGRIEAIRFTRIGVGGTPTRMPTLVLTVRPLDRPDAQAQELGSDAPTEKLSAYFGHHRAGDVVATWVHRKSGRIVEVMPPDAPDLARFFLILLPTLGLFTFCIIFTIFAHRSQNIRARA